MRFAEVEIMSDALRRSEEKIHQHHDMMHHRSTIDENILTLAEPDIFYNFVWISPEMVDIRPKLESPKSWHVEMTVLCV